MKHNLLTCHIDLEPITKRHANEAAAHRSSRLEKKGNLSE